MELFLFLSIFINQTHQNNTLKDTFITKGKRRELAKILINKGIKDRNVLNAIQSIPRHIFFEPEFANHAYEDKAFPILKSQTISQPYTVAFQSELLEVEKGDKILEIGTGSGYQAAVLHFLGAKVYSVEIIPELVEFAKDKFHTLEMQINHKHSDGTMGWPEKAPFDKIIVTAGAPSVPSPLLNQLKIGGILIIPVGKESNAQKMVKLTRTPNGFDKKVLSDFSFVPLTGELGWSK